MLPGICYQNAYFPKSMANYRARLWTKAIWPSHYLNQCWLFLSIEQQGTSRRGLRIKTYIFFFRECFLPDNGHIFWAKMRQNVLNNQTSDVCYLCPLITIGGVIHQPGCWIAIRKTRAPVVCKRNTQKWVENKSSKNNANWIIVSYGRYWASDIPFSTSMMDRCDLTLWAYKKQSATNLGQIVNGYIPARDLKMPPFTGVPVS